MTAPTDNPNGPRTIKASEFKAKCLKLMDEVAENGDEIIITKNGKPVAKLVACRKEGILEFGRHHGRADTDTGGYRCPHAGGMVRLTRRRGYRLLIVFDTQSWFGGKRVTAS